MKTCYTRKKDNTYLFLPPVVSAKGIPRKTELHELSWDPWTVPCGMVTLGALPGAHAAGAAYTRLDSSRVARAKLVAVVANLTSPILLDSKALVAAKLIVKRGRFPIQDVKKRC